MTDGTIILLRIISLLLYLMLVVIELLLVSRTKCWRGETIAWLCVGIHGVIYSTIYLLDVYNALLPEGVSMIWGSGLRLQVLFTLVLIETFRLLRRRWGIKIHGC
jgi:hypothetical protein